MKNVLIFSLLAVLVVILGGFAGWYYYLHTQVQTIHTQDAARGFGVEAPLGSAGGISSFAQASSTASSGTVQTQRFVHLSAQPVAGIAFAATSTVRYAERATGYVYDDNLANGTSVRRTNTLMPKIYEAAFGPRGLVIERTMDGDGSIATFSGLLSSSSPDTTGTSTPLTGISLASDLVRVSVNPSTGLLFALQKTAEGVSGIEMQPDGSKQTKVFSSALVDWRASFLSDGRVVLVQDAADGIPGYAYTLSRSGVLAPLLRDVPGLTVLARSGSSDLLWGGSSGSGLQLYMRLNASTTPEQLTVQTTADKCVWAPDSAPIAYCAVPQTAPSGNYLDQWYRGESHTSDTIWRIDGQSGEAAEVYSPSTSVDVQDLAIDSSGSYLAFINSIDDTAWALRIAP